MKSKTPWHVNASKRDRIVGDETAPSGTYTTMTINSANSTVATVYHRDDAAFIKLACNAHDDLLEACHSLVGLFRYLDASKQLSEQVSASLKSSPVIIAARAAIAKATP